MRLLTFAYKYKSNIIALLCIGIYIILSSYKLYLPGLHYDEVFYMNAALGPIDNNFVLFKIGNFPIMIMDYIGALKAWIYSPIFHLFGVSPFSIRFPNIFITALGLWLTYRITKKVFSEKIALLSLFLLCQDPSLIILTRLDFGPVVLSLLIRIISMSLFYKFVRSIKLKDALLFFVFLAIGIFNKLDFIWFVTAVCVAGIYFYQKELCVFWNMQKANVKKIIISTSVFIVCIGLLFLLTTKYYETIDLFYFQHFKKLIQDTFQFMNGTLFYQAHLGSINRMLPRFVSIFIFSTLILRFLNLSMDKKKSKNPAVLLYYICFLIFCQIVITNRAGAAWHIFMMQPFIVILFAEAVIWLTDLAGKRSSTILTILVSCITLYNFYIFKAQIGSYSTPKSIYWSPAIYDLIRYAKKTDAQFVSVDWGMHNQLQAFDHKKGKYYDGWTIFIKDPNDVKTKMFLLNSFYQSSKPTIFILNPAAYASFEQPRKTFFRIAKENNINLKKILEFQDNSKTVYELYKAF